MEIGKQAFPEITEDPTFVILKDYDERKASFSRYGLPKRYFKSFLRFHENPLVNECTEKVMKYIEPGQEASEKTLIMLFHPTDYKDIQILKAEFRELAEEKRGEEYIFVMSNTTEGPCKSFAENNGIKHTPILQIAQVKNWKLERYEHQGSYTKQDMISFFKKWKAGSINRAYKSAEPPENNTGPVYQVVGKTFDDMVIKPNKDVLVKFYAPWCGHCKHLEPIYEELAKKLENDEHVRIVRIDSTENEIPNVQINGYPTLKLYRAEDKRYPIPYDGERTVEAMEKFLKEMFSFKEETKSDL
jgi:protein disulfide-isomerase A1